MRSLLLDSNLGSLENNILTIIIILSLVVFFVVFAVFMFMDYRNTKSMDLRKMLYRNIQRTPKFEVTTVYTDKSKNFSGTEILPEPTKPATKQYTYIFAGWDKNYLNESGDTVAKAVFVKKLNTCIVNFYADDKTTLLKSMEVKYGESADISGLIPTKMDTMEFVYKFSGWSKDVSKVESDENVYAQFDAYPKKFTYTFLDYDQKTILSQKTELFGTKIICPEVSNFNADGLKFSHFANFTDGMTLEKNEAFVAVYTSEDGSITTYKPNYKLSSGVIDSSDVLISSNDVMKLEEVTLDMNLEEDNQSNKDITAIDFAPAIVNIPSEENETTVETEILQVTENIEKENVETDRFVDSLEDIESIANEILNEVNNEANNEIIDEMNNVEETNSAVLETPEVVEEINQELDKYENEVHSDEEKNNDVYNEYKDEVVSQNFKEDTDRLLALFGDIKNEPQEKIKKTGYVENQIYNDDGSLIVKPKQDDFIVDKVQSESVEEGEEFISEDVLKTENISEIESVEEIVSNEEEIVSNEEEIVSNEEFVEDETQESVSFAETNSDQYIEDKKDSLIVEASEEEEDFTDDFVSVSSSEESVIRQDMVIELPEKKPEIDKSALEKVMAKPKPQTITKKKDGVVIQINVGEQPIKNKLKKNSFEEVDQAEKKMNSRMMFQQNFGLSTINHIQAKQKQEEKAKQEEVRKDDGDYMRKISVLATQRKTEAARISKNPAQYYNAVQMNTGKYGATITRTQNGKLATMQLDNELDKVEPKKPIQKNKFSSININYITSDDSTDK